MTASPSWLMAALASCESCCLDNEADRARVLETIIEAFPREEMVAALRDTVHAQLRRDRVAGVGDQVITAIARNCAASAEAVLELPAGEVA